MSTASAGPRAEAIRKDRRKPIVDAAIKCVRRHGAANISVEDIAICAGISRRTLYRYYSGRRAIMQDVVYDRLLKIGAGMKESLRLCDGFEESIIVGSIEAIRLARADAIFRSIVSEDGSLTRDADPNDQEMPINSITSDVWADLFRDAARAGLLRPHVSDWQALRWLMEVLEFFNQRPDLTLDEISERLHRFVVPSIVTDDHLELDRAARTKVL